MTTSAQGPTAQPHTLYQGPQIDALLELHGLGAHLVLADPETKQPAWGWRRNWNTRRPALEALEAHVAKGGAVGVIPASLGLSALDMDRGGFEDMLSLVTAHPGAAVCSSRTPGRFHVYYQDDTPRASVTWQWRDAGGEVRSGNGYLVMWGDTPERVLSAVKRSASPWQQHRFPFPVELVGRLSMLGPRFPNTPKVKPRADLSDLSPGQRNQGLYDALRAFAYRLQPGPSRSDFIERVQAQARAMARTISDRISLGGFADSEVDRTAVSVGSKVWPWQSWHSDPDGRSRPPLWTCFDRELQQLRAWQGGIKRRETTKERDQEILEERRKGRSFRDLGRLFGIHHVTAWRAVRRGVQGLLDVAAPSRGLQPALAGPAARPSLPLSENFQHLHSFAPDKEKQLQHQLPQTNHTPPRDGSRNTPPATPAPRQAAGMTYESDLPRDGP